MAGRIPTTADVRFAEKCRPRESGCVEWTGGTTTKGYGLFHFDGRMRPAHRWAYEQAHGPVGAEIDVCHHCDNPRCVNLDHLFAGTRLDNMRDAKAKGRTSRKPRNVGESHPRASLKTKDVLQMREWHAAGWPMRHLSDTFGVSFAQVSRIVHRLSWAHI